MAIQKQAHIIVLGAGVIGLQTAINLLQAGFVVTVIAKDWPGDQNPNYTSMWAGAQWRSTSKMRETGLQNWERRTFQHWQELCSQQPASKIGIAATAGLYYWDSSASQQRRPEQWIWWTSFIPELRHLTREELPVLTNSADNNDDGIEGITYQSFGISPEVYLKNLATECKDLGARLMRAEVTKLADVFGYPGCETAAGVINCVGISGQNLMGDADLYPTKGQAVIVRGEAKRISTGLGAEWEAVVVPRKGLNETFLGVTKYYADGSVNIEDAATQKIIEQAKPLVPELLDENGNFTVLRVQVGLRPTRHGGTRVELEELQDGNGPAQGKWVCHNYGHHGAGYEQSFGCAETVVQLVSEQLRGAA